MVKTALGAAMIKPFARLPGPRQGLYIMAPRRSVREAMRTAQQVASLSKAARRTIPYSILLARWKPRGLSERAALDSLREEKLEILDTT
jgi:hypothetical protein